MAHVTDQLNTALADRHVIERELGQGGMAMVYLARDLKHNRKVAHIPRTSRAAPRSTCGPSRS